MKKLLASLLFAILLATFPATATYGINPDFSKAPIDTRPAANPKQLSQRATLVIRAWADTAYEKFPEHRQVEGRQIVKYAQRVHIKQILKGRSSAQLVTLLSEGVEPLPDASSPLNKRYPGPLAEGDYICFLQQVPGFEAYTLVGLWQGLYPLYEGKTIALEGFGFPQLHNLTPNELQKKLPEL